MDTNFHLELVQMYCDYLDYGHFLGNLRNNLGYSLLQHLVTSDILFLKRVIPGGPPWLGGLVCAIHPAATGWYRSTRVTISNCLPV